MKKYLILLTPFFIVVILAIIAGFALLHPGLPPTHDGEYHVVRSYEFTKVLRQGNFYPRWAPDLNFGYGIPLFTYVYPFPNYIASIVALIGMQAIDAFKLNMFMAIIIGALFFYLWGKEIWGSRGGVIGAVFYTFSPYHFVDVYIRGSVGEVWALAWYPACLWITTKIIKQKKYIYALPGGTFLALIIFSHNILALAFSPFLLWYISILLIYKNEKLQVMKILGIMILVGLGLSMIFWLPALSETKYTTGLQIYSIDQNFPDLYQLLIPSWGSDFFGTGSSTEMSVQIGIANLLVVLFSFFTLFWFWKKRDTRGVIAGLFLFSFWGIFFLMLKFSLPIWQTIPLMSYFQFSWRLLSLEILICSFLAGSLTVIFPRIWMLGILLLLPIILSLNYDKPSHYLYRTDQYYITRSNFIDGTNSPGNEFQTEWVHSITSRAKEPMNILKEEGKITIQKSSITQLISTCSLSKASTIQVNIAYFPGWTVFIDGNIVPIIITRQGLISFLAPKGTHTCKVALQNTFIENVATAVTLVTLILSITILGKNWYSNRRKNEYSA